MPWYRTLALLPFMVTITVGTIAVVAYGIVYLVRSVR